MRRRLAAAVAIAAALLWPHQAVAVGPHSASPLRGILGYADPGLGPRYLAVPWGRGVYVRVCGAAHCISLVSTDAGPDLQRQREGRIGDLAVGLWSYVTGLPSSRGLAHATITRLGSITPPPTDTARAIRPRGAMVPR